MNYRSAMVLGSPADSRATPARRPAHDLRAPDAGPLGGRRKPSPKERAATLTLALDLAESSVKVSVGGPDDDSDDLADPVLMRLWAGRVPLAEAFGEPAADALCPPGTPVPDYVRAWSRT